MKAVTSSRVTGTGRVDVAGRVRTLVERHEVAALTFVWLLTAVWAWRGLDQGWVPFDDGAFGQSAVRLLDGQLPHREFAELYTGGMTYLNAAALAVFGEDLVVLRYPLFAVFLGLVAAAYYIARSVADPLTALLATAVVATWSIPVYPSPVPSWYVLAFAVFGAAALIRWRDTANDRWLLLCGVLGGLSIAFKITGVYFVVAVVTFLVLSHPRARRDLQWWRAAVVPVALAALAGGLVMSVLGGKYGASEVVNLVAPIVAVVVAACIGHVRGREDVLERTGDGSLGRSLTVLAAGSAVPISVVLSPYVVAGATHDFLNGVFVSPQSRREFAYLATPNPGKLLVALSLVALLALRSRVSHRTRQLLDIVLSVVAVLLLAVATSLDIGYQSFWDGGRALGPVIVAIGALFVIRKVRSGRVPDELVFLLVALVAFMSLVQFPYGRPVYYCYVAPLVALAAVAVSSATLLKGSYLLRVLLACFAIFGAVVLDRSAVTALGIKYVREGQVALLDEDRSSIRVFPQERNELPVVVDLLRTHTTGRSVYAGPDLPHIYFLADMDNPTRSLFDFLDTSGSARGDALLGTLRRVGVTAIAINLEPELSDPLEPETLAALRSTYPRHRTVGTVEVRWTVTRR